MELSRKHRPNDFSDLIGQPTAVSTLESLLTNKKRFPHAVLLTGPSGCGKTTIARILKEKLGCEDLYYDEKNIADFKGIDTIREIRSRMGLSAGTGGCRIFYLDECHKLTGDAQNALLKMLEDPPKHVYFFLATTDPGKLIRTIQTRVTQISVSLLSDKDVAKLVLDVAAKEKIELSDAVVEKIVQCSAGSARMALVHLNTIIDIDNEEEQINAIQPEATKRDAFEIVKALLWEKTDWKKMAGILSTIETDDWEGLRYLVLANANKEILKAGKSAGWAYLILTCFESNWYDSKRAGLIRACYEVLQSK